MEYIKSRIDIREAAKERLAETNTILDACRKELVPIMTKFDINTPEEVVDRLLETKNKGVLKGDDEDIKKLIFTLTRYERAKGARVGFKFVIDHIADFGEFEKIERMEGAGGDFPVEWHYVELNESEVGYFFETYEGMEDSPRHYSMEKAAGVRGTNISRLHQLMGPSLELGMSNALQR